MWYACKYVYISQKLVEKEAFFFSVEFYAFSNQFFLNVDCGGIRIHFFSKMEY